MTDHYINSRRISSCFRSVETPTGAVPGEDYFIKRQPISTGGISNSSCALVQQKQNAQCRSLPHPNPSPKGEGHALKSAYEWYIYNYNCRRLMETCLPDKQGPTGAACSGWCPRRPQTARQCGNLECILSTGEILRTHLRRILITIIAVAIFTGAQSQDKAAMVKEFNEVMSFSVQHWLHYTTYTTMEASPVLQQADTLSDKGEFFKNGNDIYYRSSQEEMFLEDSFFIRINNEKKTISISKVNVDTKEKMNLLPLSTRKMQKLFQKEYVISKSAVGAESSRLNFQPASQGLSGITIEIAVQYSNEKKLPELMQLDVNMKQAATDEMVQQVKSSSARNAQLVQMIDGQPYLVRHQSVTIRFENIDNSKEKAMQIPSWKSRIDFNPTVGVFRGKGNFSDYEITKTF